MHSLHGHGSDTGRLQEYQQNTAFIGFTLLVCTAAVVYLTKSLSSVVVPLLWAAFTAMPLTGLIDLLNPWMIRCSRTIGCCFTCQCWHRSKVSESCLLESNVDFLMKPGEAYIRLRKDQADDLLQQVNEPDWSVCPRFFFVQICCRRRVQVKELMPVNSAEEVPKREVNRVVNGWRYYVREARRVPSHIRQDTAARDERVLELFLDHGENYPAIVSADPDIPAQQGRLEVDTTHTISYIFATMVAMAFILLIVGLFVWLVSVGANSMTDNVQNYVKGGEELIKWMNSYLQDVLPDAVNVDLSSKAQAELKERLPEIASKMLTMLEGIGFELLLFLLYLLFWTMEPLPVNYQVSALFRTYLLQKSLVCLIFATCMSALLLSLQCPLWHILFLVCFLLNYIPEVGPIICFVIILPLVLLDGNLTMKARSVNAIVYTITFWIVKFVTGNIIEVQLYAKSGGDLMRMHPVVMLALMMLFEALMGMTGMFMTVPVMAAAKYYMLSMNMPPAVLDPLLMCIEGTEQGPHMNFVEQQRASLQKKVVDEDDEEDSEYDFDTDELEEEQGV